MKKYKLNYRVIGDGLIWNGWNTLMKEMRDTLKTLPKDLLVCKVDAFDVLVAGGEAALDAKWASLKDSKNVSPIIVGAEPKSFIYDFIYKTGTTYYDNNKLIINDLDFPCFNAGCIIGLAEDLANFYTWALDNKYQDDQIAIVDYADMNPHKVILDHQRKLVANIGIGEDFEFEESSPVFLHLPNYYWDFCSRIDHYGKKLLGDDYKPLSIITKVSIFLTKLKDGTKTFTRRHNIIFLVLFIGVLFASVSLYIWLNNKP